MDSTSIIVLDTNAVLDWLLFRNPDGNALHSAIEAGAVRWLATEAMRLELEHLLTRADFSAWDGGPSAIWRGWERHCAELPESAAPPATRGLRCTDPDDQKFIDFAVACNARWLVSRDRAVLKLGRRMRALGTVVTTPAAWLLDRAVPSGPCGMVDSAELSTAADVRRLRRHACPPAVGNSCSRSGGLFELGHLREEM